MPLPLLIAAAPWIIGGLSALGGWFGGREKKYTSQQKTRQTFDRTTTQTPTFDPKQLAMRDNLINAFMGRLSPQNTTGLANAMATEGIQNINLGAATQRRMLQESLVARGLGQSGISSALGSELEGGRIGNIVRTLNQRKLIADQIQGQNLASAGTFFGQLPHGTTVRDTGENITDVDQTSTVPGNRLASMFGALSTTLAGLYGRGGFGGTAGTESTPRNEPPWYPTPTFPQTPNIPAPPPVTPIPYQTPRNAPAWPTFPGPPNTAAGYNPWDPRNRTWA